MSTISQWMKSNIESAVKQVFEESGADYPDGGVQIRIEQPSSIEHGDYSTSAAMQLARILRKPPMLIAERIIMALEQQGIIHSLVASMEAAAPGFINFRIHWEKWACHTFELPAGGGGKAVIEHTSINPNKSAHIGHLRNSCIGDSLVRLLRRTGHEVEVHNYIDDLGNQLADTVVGMLNVPLSREHVRFGDYCWDIYSMTNKQYESDAQLSSQRPNVLHALEEGGSNLSWIGLLVAERIVREHLEEMKQFGIEYDLLVWESNIVREGFWASAFELLQQTSMFHQVTEGKLAGCWVLKQSGEDGADSGDSEADASSDHSADKVLVRSNGILTYTAKDIAYHLWKFGLLKQDFQYHKFADQIWTTGLKGTVQPFGQADIVINVIDHRQEYPQKMVKQALQALGYTREAEKLHHVSYGVVSLSPASAEALGIDTTDGKTSYAMSGRQGFGIRIAELLDRMERVIEENRSDQNGLPSRIIAAAAIRYYLLRFNMHTEVVFDLQQATEISGNTGVYLLYSYARAISVLNKAQQLGVSPSVPSSMKGLERAEHALIRQISLWLDTLHSAGQELAPSVICSYAHELATLFNNFYASCPILKADQEKLKLRVWLASKFEETLRDALEVLGMPAPSRM